MTSAPGLWFEPGVSRIALALTGAIGLLAIAAAASSGWPAAGRLGIMVVVGLALLHALRRLAIPSRLRFELRPDGGWVMRDHDAKIAATLQGAHDLGFLIALHFRTDADRRIDVVLWPDAIPSDQRRQLRVWLGRNGRS